MTRRARLVIAVTAATLLSSATAFADGWGGPGGTVVGVGPLAGRFSVPSA